MNPALERILRAKIASLETDIKRSQSPTHAHEVAVIVRNYLLGSKDFKPMIEDVYQLKMGKPCTLTNSQLSTWVSLNLKPQRSIK